MDNELIEKKWDLTQKLYFMGALWSYKIYSDTVLSDDRKLVVKGLSYLEFEDIWMLWDIFPEEYIRQVWEENMLLSETFYGSINHYLAYMLFGVDDYKSYQEKTSRKLGRVIVKRKKKDSNGSFYRRNYKFPNENNGVSVNHKCSESQQEALGKKLFAITQIWDHTFKEYYDIYILLKAGCSLYEGFCYAVKISKQTITFRTIAMTLMAPGLFKKKSQRKGIVSKHIKVKPVTVFDICVYIEHNLKEIRINKKKPDNPGFISIGELYFDAITKIDSHKLIYVLDKLSEYNKMKDDEEKLDFLKSILSSVGINLYPYNIEDDGIEARKYKDIKSLIIVEDFLSEYALYNEMTAKIEEQKNLINEIPNLTLETSIRKKLCEGCEFQINRIGEEQQNLRYYNEFAKAEKGRI